MLENFDTFAGFYILLVVVFLLGVGFLMAWQLQENRNAKLRAELFEMRAVASSACNDLRQRDATLERLTTQIENGNQLQARSIQQAQALLTFLDPLARHGNTANSRPSQVVSVAAAGDKFELIN